MHDKDQLLARIAQGWQPGYLCFWGHKQTGTSVTKACFSQWYPAEFEVDGQCYPTAEHYMMAEKARLFGDNDCRRKILACTGPDQAKQLGRKAKGFDAERWEAHGFDIVVAGNLAKFSQHPELKAFLLATGDKVLIEASPVDSIWGIGLAQDHPHATQPERWPGRNLLGFALMTVRDQLMA